MKAPRRRLFAAALLLCLFSGGSTAHIDDLQEENSQPGADSTEWDVNGAGDPSIVGFADAASYRGGDEVVLSIKTEAVRAPHCDQSHEELTQIALPTAAPRAPRP